MHAELQALQQALQRHQPNLFAALKPGVQARAWSRELREWFAWRNGQDRASAVELFETYRFTSYEDARAELSQLRRTLWQHPLQGLALLIFARRSFYSLPLLTDAAGDGYYFNLLRRRPFYTFKGEQDLYITSLSTLIAFWSQYVAQGNERAAIDYENRFLEELR